VNFEPRALNLQPPVLNPAPCSLNLLGLNPESITLTPIPTTNRAGRQYVQAHGWAWEYQLNALSVDNIEVMTPSRVMVEATLTEVAILKDRARTEVGFT